jgi:hypothetical protein
MKHTTEELLLALGVRDLAMRRWVRALPDGLTPAEEADWKGKNPFADVLKGVVEELDWIADSIKDHRSAAQPSTASVPPTGE